jgi:nuclear pore complex protein Nup155
VHAAYDRLLATPVQRAHHDRRLVREQQLQTPALRLRLLRSALRVLQRWDQSILVGENGAVGGGAGAGAGGGGGEGGGFASYGASGAHVRAALGDVCVGYAGVGRCTRSRIQLSPPIACNRLVSSTLEPIT